MAGSSPQSRSRASSERHERRQSILENDLPPLGRVQSQEFSVVESVAVPDDPLESSCSDSEPSGSGPAPSTWPRSVRYLILLCAFLTSLSFGVTQVPLLYVFRLMTCDIYYQKHPTPEPEGSFRQGMIFLSSIKSPNAIGKDPGVDRCSLNEIESSTALSVSLLGATTTVFGIFNLFLTGRLIKSIGVKRALLIQVFFPAIRVLVQNLGVEVWGNAGIIIIQCSQIVSVVGGPSGYLLALNTFTTDVVEHEGRTAALGRLSGSQMFGSALGFLLGGVVADWFGDKAPFRLSFILFLLASTYTAVFLPHIPPEEAKTTHNHHTDDARRNVIRQIFRPLAVFSPRAFIGQDQVVRMEYGAFLLAWGVFLGILATGYLPTLLQLYATDIFGFGTKQNGWLIFMFSVLRGSFLTFLFPIIIALGRKYTSRKTRRRQWLRTPSERSPLLSSPDDSSPDHNRATSEQNFTFDLTYTRFSLILDGMLTLLCGLVQDGWQMYLVAAALPFGSGTGSAAKGTVLHMVGSSASSSARTDALAGVSLVENMARLSTTFVFGVLFSLFAGVGRTELIFVCNAGVALIGFVVLCFARFPREGSHPPQSDTETTQ